MSEWDRVAYYAEEGQEKPMATIEVTVKMEGLLGQVLQSSSLLEEAFQGRLLAGMEPTQLIQAQMALRNLRHAAEDLEALLWEGMHGAPRPWSMKEEEPCNPDWCATCQHPAPTCTCKVPTGGG